MTHRLIRARLRRVLSFVLALCMAVMLAVQATGPALADEKQEQLEANRDQAKAERLLPPGGGAVHPGDGKGGVQPARQPRAALAHGSKTDNE